MYDIIHEIISAWIYLWYHKWYHIFYDIIYDIICFILISYSISYMISYKNLWYHVWYHIYPFLALLWYCQKDMISYMISYFNYDIIYDIISFLQYHSHLPVSCAIIMPYQIRYHIHIIQNLPWYQYLMISHMKSEHIIHEMALWYQ